MSQQENPAVTDSCNLSKNADPAFLAEQKELVVFLKEGYSFWGANAELITRRFADPDKKTTVIIVHPESKLLDAVGAMDPAKESQRSDCLETVRILQMIRDVVIANGSEKAKQSFNARVTFIGHHYVPSWNGFIGDHVATANIYDTGPAPRGAMPSMTVGGEIKDRFLQNIRSLLDEAKADPSANLFNYQIPDDHRDVRAERTREINRNLIELSLA